MSWIGSPPARPPRPPWWGQGVMMKSDERVVVWHPEWDDVFGPDRVDWYDTGIMTIWESLEGEGYPHIDRPPRWETWLRRHLS